MKSKRRDIIAGMKLKLQDVRASKVWQEAYALGYVEGFAGGFKLGLRISGSRRVHSMTSQPST
jgi:hypothetical protein